MNHIKERELLLERPVGVGKESVLTKRVIRNRKRIKGGQNAVLVLTLAVHLLATRR
jgi:hypothetical protein